MPPQWTFRDSYDMHAFSQLPLIHDKQWKESASPYQKACSLRQGSCEY